MKRNRFLGLGAWIALGALGALGCGDDDSSSLDATGTGPIDPGKADAVCPASPVLRGSGSQARCANPANGQFVPNECCEAVCAGAWYDPSVINENRCTWLESHAGDVVQGSAAPQLCCDINEDVTRFLRKVPGLTFQKRDDAFSPLYQAFDLALEQPVDHNDPQGPTFVQHMTLLHRASKSPVIEAHTGYENYYGAHPWGLTVKFGANQVLSDYRFFGESRPDTVPWTFLTLWQGASDAHRVHELISQYYPGHWLATGASKGALTSVLHHRFYPGDLRGVVADGTPFIDGAPDSRFNELVTSGLGDESCRARIRDLEDVLLDRRASIAAAMTSGDRAEATYETVGGPECAVEAIVANLSWNFWSYSLDHDCSAIPTAAATDGEVISFLADLGVLDTLLDSSFDGFKPYVYQAQVEMGYTDTPVERYRDRLQCPHAGRFEEFFGEEDFDGLELTHSPGVMKDLARWVETEGSQMIFHYGQYDPLQATQMPVSKERECAVFFAAGLGHDFVTPKSLTPEDAAQEWAWIEKWLGIARLPEQN